MGLTKEETENIVSENDVLRLSMSSMLGFTQVMFAEMKGKQFELGAHHRIVCAALDDVVEGRCNRLIINIAPRYSKTELAVKNFIAYGLAVNPAAKFIHLSYSADLAMDNSVAVKDIVTSELFKRLFRVEIKRGSDTKAQWGTTLGGGVYATSTLGQITGFGAGAVDGGGDKFGGAIVIDDPIKPEDALSDNAREAVNRRFETTIRTRVNSRSTPIILIMQRLHEHDLTGYLMETEPDVWRVISLPCLTVGEDGREQALWPFKHTVEELHKIERINPFVFETQYMQDPKPIEGLMYPNLRTYEVLPVDRTARRVNYTDSADTGADYHCSIDYLEAKTGNYVIDVLYTKKAQEYTEPMQARMLTRDRIKTCYIESNNGGRAFCRNVERLCRELGNTKTSFVSFAQKLNKQVRIFSRSNEVCNMVFFPSDWEARWPEFARDMKAYRKEGRNAHDDAPDAVTGTLEKRARVNVSDDYIWDKFL